MNTKCKRVRFRIVANYNDRRTLAGRTAYALRNTAEGLSWVRINAETLAEDPRLGENRPCKEGFKTYDEFCGKAINGQFWKELRRPS